MSRRPEIFGWLVSALATVAFAGSLMLAQHVGSRARVFAGSSRALSEPPISIEMVETSADLYEALRRSGVRGRVLVSLSSFLHFMPVGNVIPEGIVSFPVSTFDLVEAFEGRVDHQTVLWVVHQSGVVREVVHVLPQEDYQRRRRELGAGTAGVVLRADAIFTHELGSRRTLRIAALPLSEPVILSIDASYLEGVGVGEALDLLRGSGLRTDRVVANLALDNRDVSDLARQRLASLADTLAGGG
jgi:hypothetical protein